MSEPGGVVLVIGDPLMGADQLGTPARSLLGGRFEVVDAAWDATLDEAIEANLAIERDGPDAVAARMGGDVEDSSVIAVLTQFFPLTRAVLDRFPELKVVATLRAGTENIDEEALRERGIPLLANSGRNANAVAEMTVALLLATLRGLGESHHSVRTGGWRPDPPTRGYHELRGSRIGLVGMGAVARTVLDRLAGFELEAAYFDPYVPEGSVTALPMELEELLKRSDVLSLHARVGPGSRALLGAEELDLLPRGAVVINSARAELIDEAALMTRLADGRIGGAGLDVFSIEPLPLTHPVRRMRNVTLSPHLAGSTVEARSGAPKRIAERLAAALSD